MINGVENTQVGYANGKTINPTYEEVCHKNTGHAETVKVVYNPEVITLDTLLSLFYEAINPTAVNRQGGDSGVQYRTGIYYIDDVELPIIQNSIQQLQLKHDKPIAIEVEPLRNFSPAEEYHQRYLDKNPNGYCHIHPSQFERAKRVNQE